MNLSETVLPCMFSPGFRCLFFINVLTFSQIAENVIDSEAIVTIDQEVTHFLFKARNQVVGQIFYLISYLGSQKGSIIIGAIVSVFLLRQGRKTYFVALWLVLLGVGLSVRYGKLIFHRARPVDVGFYEETNFSFPSGHSTTAMVLFGMITYFLMRNSRSKQQRIIYLLSGLLIIMLVGFSRIYLGVHFLSDVLGGYLLGATWMIMGITVIEWLSYKKELRNIPQ
jgi:undecaprenyl-diphosphatase